MNTVKWIPDKILEFFCVRFWVKLSTGPCTKNRTVRSNTGLLAILNWLIPMHMKNQQSSSSKDHERGKIRTDEKKVFNTTKRSAEHLHVPATKEKDRRAGRLNEVRAPTTWLGTMPVTSRRECDTWESERTAIQHTPTHPHTHTLPQIIPHAHISTADFAITWPKRRSRNRRLSAKSAVFSDVRTISAIFWKKSRYTFRQYFLYLWANNYGCKKITVSKPKNHGSFFDKLE